MAQILMVFSPHPDDAEFYAGGTIAKMVQEGAQAFIVIVTDGRAGSYHLAREQLIETRMKEAQSAAQVLGAQPPIFLQYPDMELDQLPPGHLRSQFIHLIRKYKPDIVIAQDAFTGFEIHPDHRAVAWAVSEALNSALLPLVHPEQLANGLEPHFVKEKYFYTDQIESANKIIDISQTMSVKLAALAKHQSQMEFLVEDVLLQAEAAGVDLKAIVGAALNDPVKAITWALQIQAAQIGQKANFQYGEAFRHTRFHPIIEGLLQP